MQRFEAMTPAEQALHQLRRHGGQGTVVAFGEDAASVHARAHERGADHEHEQETALELP